ncbi:LysR family transcriptional regulator [Niallia taxi]|uniref:LysR family transcriptional regulator n=1 Tax=Niallia taxi TaxID=2499688 RepID=UPI00203AF5E3|nr:LysR family transcriptional regulator [Niallia taxi]MCM3217725.1 LysR family transcriptional regulator [Niallia taxi]
MELRTLKIFQSIAKQGSFSNAARELNYAQSNITMKMQQLEEELQITLFNRHNRGVSLTSKGEKLLIYTERIFQLMEEAINDISDKEEPHGSLTIGSMETTAGVRLPAILAQYLKDYPQIDINLKTGTTEANIQGVLNYELDGAFVAGPVNHKDLLSKKAFEEKLVLVTDISQRSIEPIEDIQNKALLVFHSGCSYRSKFEEWFQKENRKFPNKLMEFGTLDGIIGCVAARIGVSLLPQSVISKQVEKGKVRTHNIPEQYAKVDTLFIYRKDKYVTGALKQFLHLLNRGAD